MEAGARRLAPRRVAGRWCRRIDRDRAAIMDVGSGQSGGDGIAFTLQELCRIGVGDLRPEPAGLLRGNGPLQASSVSAKTTRLNALAIGSIATSAT
jgi:hypothetical protein